MKFTIQFGIWLGFSLLTLCLLGGLASAADVAMLRNGFSIRHQRREVIEQVTRLYLGSAADGYIDIPTAEIIAFDKDETPVEDVAAKAVVTSLPPLDSAVSAASTRHGIDSDLITSVIHAESDFKAHAISPKGARGLMQLMPQTASHLGISNPFDPAANVDGGTRYLRELLDFYHDDMIKALAAYNAGPQRVARYHGVPPYHETHAYVARVIREFNRKKLAQRRAEAAKAGIKTAAVKVKSPSAP